MFNWNWLLNLNIHFHIPRNNLIPKFRHISNLLLNSIQYNRINLRSLWRRNSSSFQEEIQNQLSTSTHWHHLWGSYCRVLCATFGQYWDPIVHRVSCRFFLFIVLQFHLPKNKQNKNLRFFRFIRPIFHFIIFRQFRSNSYNPFLQQRQKSIQYRYWCYFNRC